MNTKKILIVDDEVDSFGFLLDSLEDYGYNVLSVTNGENALKSAEKAFFDVILIDFNLPGMNGLQTLVALKKISPLSIAIIMTAAAPESLLKQVMEEGAFAIVKKPFKIEDMVEKIDEAASRLKVMVVNEDFKAAGELKAVLERIECKCLWLPGPGDALKVLKHEKPDILFATENAMRELKAVDPSIKVVTIAGPLDPDKICRIVDKISGNLVKSEDKQSILIIEDNETLMDTLGTLLERSNYNVAKASTGEEALEKTRKGQYGACLVDYKLPDTSGIDLIKKIKAINPGIVIILMTAYESLDVAIAAIRERVFDFLIKPVEPNVLLKSLRRGLKKAGAG
jgi:DNA-binding NtrC family response regulator